MAMHPTTPLTALAIAARLVKANIPFTLEVKSQTMAEIQCKFEEVLGEAVMQQHREDGHTPTGRLVKPFEPELQLFPRRISETEQQQKFFIDLPSGTEEVHCTAHDPASRIRGEHLNDWEDATHQITFDNGTNWTNVKLKYGYYLACSDGKRSWRADSIDAANVVKRPEAK